MIAYTFPTQAELDAMTDPRLLSIRDMADKKRAAFLDTLYSKVEQGYTVNVLKDGKLVEQIKLNVPALLNGESVDFEMTPKSAAKPTP
jgi:hypothetical protein